MSYATVTVSGSVPTVLSTVVVPASRSILTQSGAMAGQTSAGEPRSTVTSVRWRVGGTATFTAYRAPAGTVTGRLFVTDGAGELTAGYTRCRLGELVPGASPYFRMRSRRRRNAAVSKPVLLCNSAKSS